MKTKRNIIIALAFFLCANAFAQSSAQARKVLDRAAAIVGSRSGAAASFSISGGTMGRTTGNIAIKGNKFKATTPQATIWFDGKTQWSYMKSTNEVNISTPNEAQRMSLNPYAFISMYRNGYNISMKTKGNTYVVHLKAMHPARSVQEFYITLSKSYHPKMVKLLQGKKWVTIYINNFRTAAQPDSLFRFSRSNAPSAEIIDLR